MEPQEQAFWDRLRDIGKDILKNGEKLNYGNILMEVKMQKGLPVIIVRSASTNNKFGDNKTAKIAISKTIDDREANTYDGAQTFTVIWHKGNINRILLDEYENMVL